MHSSISNTGPDMEHHSLGKTHSSFLHFLCCPYKKPARHSQVQSNQREKLKRPLTLSVLKDLEACVTLNGTVYSYDPLPSCGITKKSSGTCRRSKGRWTEQVQRKKMKTGSREVAEQYILGLPMSNKFINLDTNSREER